MPVRSAGMGWGGLGGPAAGVTATGPDSAAADAAAARAGGPLAAVPETLPPQQYVSLEHEFKPPLEPYEPGTGIAVIIGAICATLRLSAPPDGLCTHAANGRMSRWCMPYMYVCKWH